MSKMDATNGMADVAEIWTAMVRYSVKKISIPLIIGTIFGMERFQYVLLTRIVNLTLIYCDNSSGRKDSKTKLISMAKWGRAEWKYEKFLKISRNYPEFFGFLNSHIQS